MIKLMDFDVAQPGVVTIYADTKAEVPATAAALKAELEGDLTDRWDSEIAAGSLIYTSSLDVGFVKGDGSVAFVGDTPTPPAEPATVTITSEIDEAYVVYIDAEDDTMKTEHYTTTGEFELSVPDGSLIAVIPGGIASGGSVTTTADAEVFGSADENGQYCKAVLIEGDTAISLGW